MTQRKLFTSIGAILLSFSILLSGCSTFTMMIEKITKRGAYMTPEEEQQVRNAAIQYIQETYDKELVIQDIVKDRVFGNSYDIDGYIKDGKNTPIFITGNPGDFRDSYVDRLWSNELTPHITKIVQQHFDVREINDIIYSDGTKKTSYTGEIPSVFEVLKKGEKNFTLDVELRVYEQNGQFESGISQLLHELKKMNFNDVIVTVLVYDDTLKANPNKEKPENDLLYRYNISGDIQQIEIDHLDSYKTIIKE